MSRKSEIMELDVNPGDNINDLPGGTHAMQVVWLSHRLQLQIRDGHSFPRPSEHRQARRVRIPRAYRLLGLWQGGIHCAGS